MAHLPYMFKYARKIITIIVLAAFVTSSIKNPAYAQSLESAMPMPGVRVHLSPEFTPAYLQGITIHPDNALQFDFLIHKSDVNLEGDQKTEEYKRLVKYFLASLTIPDDDQWVNLSPYEKNRIIKDDFGKTEMGRNLLAEDYLLKQITSSLLYPEEGLGRKFWDKVYQRAWEQYHTSQVPVNTFNKVWIVPDQAIVYESGNTAYILQSHLKVMLEEDYLSLQKHTGINPQGQPGDMTSVVSPRRLPISQGLQSKAPQGTNRLPNDTHTIGSQVIREIVLPELEKEVNEGKNFAALRQMYSGMILATWYKKALKESLLGKVYANQAKVLGVTGINSNNTIAIAIAAKQSQELIYDQYLRAFKKGVFNYIKEDIDKYTNESIPRKYFSGGFRNPGQAAMLTVNPKTLPAFLQRIKNSVLWQQLMNNLGSTMDTAVVKLQQLNPMRTMLPLITPKRVAVTMALALNLGVPAIIQAQLNAPTNAPATTASTFNTRDPINNYNDLTNAIGYLENELKEAQDNETNHLYGLAQVHYQNLGADASNILPNVESTNLVFAEGNYNLPKIKEHAKKVDFIDFVRMEEEWGEFKYLEMMYYQVRGTDQELPMARKIAVIISRRLQENGENAVLPGYLLHDYKVLEATVLQVIVDNDLPTSLNQPIKPITTEVFYTFLVNYFQTNIVAASQDLSTSNYLHGLESFNLISKQAEQAETQLSTNLFRPGYIVMDGKGNVIPTTNGYEQPFQSIVIESGVKVQNFLIDQYGRFNFQFDHASTPEAKTIAYYRFDNFAASVLNDTNIYIRPATKALYQSFIDDNKAMKAPKVLEGVLKIDSEGFETIDGKRVPLGLVSKIAFKHRKDDAKDLWKTQYPTKHVKLGMGSVIRILRHLAEISKTNGPYVSRSQVRIILGGGLEAVQETNMPAIVPHVNREFVRIILMSRNIRGQRFLTLYHFFTGDKTFDETSHALASIPGSGGLEYEILELRKQIIIVERLDKLLELAPNIDTNCRLPVIKEFLLDSVDSLVAVDALRAVGTSKAKAERTVFALYLWKKYHLSAGGYQFILDTLKAKQELRNIPNDDQLVPLHPHDQVGLQLDLMLIEDIYQSLQKIRKIQSDIKKNLKLSTNQPKLRIEEQKVRDNRKHLYTFLSPDASFAMMTDVANDESENGVYVTQFAEELTAAGFKDGDALKHFVRDFVDQKTTLPALSEEQQEVFKIMIENRNYWAPGKFIKMAPYDQKKAVNDVMWFIDLVAKKMDSAMIIRKNIRLPLRIFIFGAVGMIIAGFFHHRFHVKAKEQEEKILKPLLDNDSVMVIPDNPIVRLFRMDTILIQMRDNMDNVPDYNTEHQLKMEIEGLINQLVPDNNGDPKINARLDETKRNVDLMAEALDALSTQAGADDEKINRFKDLILLLTLDNKYALFGHFNAYYDWIDQNRNFKDAIQKKEFNPKIPPAKSRLQLQVDSSKPDNGGIDFNGANLNLQIRRDGRGVPLPLSQQDLTVLSQIQGFTPDIIQIKSAASLPILSEIQRAIMQLSV